MCLPKMNIFRAVGDFSHVISFILLFHQLWKTKSSSGISGKSQILFAIVFTARYIDLATTFISVYNTVFKVLYLIASYSIVLLVYTKFKKTYDHNHDTFYNEFLILPAFTLALLINYSDSVIEILWTFSTYLESVAILPQLSLARKTKEAEAFTLRYVLALSAYKGFYVLNWVYRYYVEDHYDFITTLAGVAQVVLYLLFFVYLFLLKDCCINGPQDDQLLEVRNEEPLQKDYLVAVHLGLNKEQQDSKIVVA